MALEGCRKIYTMQKEALKTKYVNVSEENKDEEEAEE
jgi:hypothetical protein